MPLENPSLNSDIVDPNGHLSETSTRQTFTGLTRNETAYSANDHGVGHFSGNFNHDYSWRITAVNGEGFVATHALGNTLGDWQTIFNANGDLLVVEYFNRNPNARYILREMNNGNLTTDIFESPGITTTYFDDFDRDESVGVFGTQYLDTYDNEAKTNLISALSVTLTEKQDFRYRYDAQSINDSGAGDVNGWKENINLNEATSNLMMMGVG